MEFPSSQICNWQVAGQYLGAIIRKGSSSQATAGCSVLYTCPIRSSCLLLWEFLSFGPLEIGSFLGSFSVSEQWKLAWPHPFWPSWISQRVIYSVWTHTSYVLSMGLVGVRGLTQNSQGNTDDWERRKWAVEEESQSPVVEWVECRDCLKKWDTSALEMQGEVTEEGLFHCLFTTLGIAPYPVLLFFNFFFPPESLKWLLNVLHIAVT